MVIWNYILIITLLLYVGVLLYYIIGFLKHPFFYPTPTTSITPVTIIICARNEEKAIVPCLLSIINQDYDKENYSVILINDASTDNTELIATKILSASKLKYKIISNNIHIGKKQSITKAVDVCNTNLIVLRDADTVTTSKIWLQTISDFYSETNSNFIIAPIAFKQNIGMLWALQIIENNILSVFNIGSTYYKKSFLCNAANLAFTKEIFFKTNGFHSHLNIASGDDVLFLEDVKKIQLDTVSYLKSQSAIVYTYAQPTFISLLLQKVRWASKNNISPNKTNIRLSYLIFFTNCIWLLAFSFSFFMPQNQSLSLIFVLFKLIFDSLLLFLSSGFLKTGVVLLYSLPIGLVYPIYVIVVGVSTLFLKPKWK